MSNRCRSFPALKSLRLAALAYLVVALGVALQTTNLKDLGSHHLWELFKSFFNLCHDQDAAMVLEEHPQKVSEAFRLFLQGQGFCLNLRMVTSSGAVY